MSERETMREAIRKSINDARQTQYEIACSQAVREFIESGEHGSEEEALESVPQPALATDDDVDAHVAWLKSFAKRLRAFVEKNGSKWEPYLRARHLVSAEELEDRVARLEPGDALRKAG